RLVDHRRGPKSPICTKRASPRAQSKSAFWGKEDMEGVRVRGGKRAVDNRAPLRGVLSPPSGGYWATSSSQGSNQRKQIPVHRRACRQYRRNECRFKPSDDGLSQVAKDTGTTRTENS